MINDKLLNHVGFELQGDVHSLELLEQELTSVGDVDCHYFGAALELSLSAAVASVLFGIFVRYRLVAASFADEYSVEVGYLEKSFS